VGSLSPVASPSAWAAIGCVHGNLEAFEAVLADIDRQGIRDIVSLGDLIGHAADPIACVDLARERCVLALTGHLEVALARGRYATSSHFAADCVEWSAAQLAAAGDRGERMGWVTGRPMCAQVEGVLLTHGSLRHPEEHLLASELPHAAEKFDEVFACFPRLLLVAHSHMPGVITSELRSFTPTELGGRYELDTRKAIVNVGSVGRPGDHDPRACWALVDGETVTWRRVAYDVERTIAKVKALGLRSTEAHCTRLREGL
jgi:hypothetical protein